VAVPETVPEVAVTVIDPPVTLPGVSVAVATPLEFVVAVVDPSVPPVVENVIVAPDTTAPVEPVAVALIVTLVVLPTATLAGLALTAIAATFVLVPQLDVEPVVPVVLPPPLKLPHPSLLPLPQPASASVSPNKAMIDANLRMFLT
jgi:hypothetical protein